VEYGVKIPEVVSAVQENVKKTVEAMTGLKVDSVNINVQSIYLKKTEKEESKEN
ncbi:Asp23/Gls24 family envelope stress response protein, partial [Clostridium perfringens]|nr:Asp23/Gls24 family envelope stress response protein [Clostridium perfringens]